MERGSLVGIGSRYRKAGLDHFTIASPPGLDRTARENSAGASARQVRVGVDLFDFTGAMVPALLER